MKLYLADVLANLGAAELSHLSLFKEGYTEISMDKFNIRLLPIINAGLIDIHTRFFVKKKQVWLRHDPGCRTLVLDKKYAESAYSVSNGKYILDCEDPFKDDVVEILAAYSESGEQYPLNQDDGYGQPTRQFSHCNSCGCVDTPEHFCSHDLNKRFAKTLDYPATITTRHPYGSTVSDRSGLPSLTTPTVNSIRLPEGLCAGFMRVEYKAAPSRIRPLEDNGVTTYENTVLDLPASYLNALVMYMAFRLTQPTNGGLQGQVNEPLAYYNKYLSACAMLQDQGIDVATTASGHGRFMQSGFR